MSRAAAAARHDAEPPQEAELLFFASLQMLGLPPTSAQKQVGALLGPTMFRQPNPKALEFVLHFLFERIRGRDNTRKVGGPPALDRQGSGRWVGGCNTSPCRPPAAGAQEHMAARGQAGQHRVHQGVGYALGHGRGRACATPPPSPWPLLTPRPPPPNTHTHLHTRCPPRRCRKWPTG
jgi:hypothetical protein